MYIARSLHQALVEDQRQQLMTASASWRAGRLARSIERSRRTGNPPARPRNRGIVRRLWDRRMRLAHS